MPLHHFFIYIRSSYIYEIYKIFDIYHSLNCKSKYVIYLLECSIYKIQYVGKSETPFHIKLNNHRKEIKDPSAISACKHFNSPNHDFNTHGKFTVIEQLRNITSFSSEILKERITQRENFWIKKLKAQAPYGLRNSITFIIYIFFLQLNSSSLCTRSNNI